MNFRIRGLEARQFDHLFALSDAELVAHGAIRRIVDGPLGAANFFLKPTNFGPGWDSGAFFFV
jgi:hypothetical protein